MFESLGPRYPEQFQQASGAVQLGSPRFEACETIRISWGYDIKMTIK